MCAPLAFHSVDTCTLEYKVNHKFYGCLHSARMVVPHLKTKRNVYYMLHNGIVCDETAINLPPKPHYVSNYFLHSSSKFTINALATNFTNLRLFSGGSTLQSCS